MKWFLLIDFFQQKNNLENCIIVYCVSFFLILLSPIINKSKHLLKYVCNVNIYRIIIINKINSHFTFFTLSLSSIYSSLVCFVSNERFSPFPMHAFCILIKICHLRDIEITLKWKKLIKKLFKWQYYHD